ncbi:MAG: hypothetical protein WKF54_00160 [Nocardioidaceae bacterium]
MTDDLEERLRAADPTTSADSTRPASSWVADLVAATMNDQSSVKSRRWRVPAAAAAIMVLGLGGYAIAQNGQDTTDPRASNSARPLELAIAGAGTSLSSCVPFSVDVLAEMPVAFSGTVVEVGEGTVLLSVDHWYRGGATEQVEISSPDLSTVSLDGAVSFSDGKRYLVTATNGVVNVCGFSAEWNADTAAAFDEAFT